MFFSTAQKDIQVTPLHAKIPMKIVKLGVVGFLYTLNHTSNAKSNRSFNITILFHPL